MAIFNVKDNDNNKIIIDSKSKGDIGLMINNFAKVDYVDSTINDLENKIDQCKEKSDTRFSIWGRGTEVTMRLIIMRQHKMNSDINTRIREMYQRLNSDDEYMTSINNKVESYKTNIDFDMYEFKKSYEKDIEEMKKKINHMYWTCGLSMSIVVIAFITIVAILY